MPEPLRVALIGFSHGHQMDYGRALAHHPDARLVAIGEVHGASVDAVELGSTFARERGVPYRDDYQTLLNNHELDAVSLAVPPTINPQVVADCASRGIHIMCEKPVAETRETFDTMADAVREARIVFTCSMPTVLLSSSFRPAIEQVRQGAIGEPRTAHFQFLQPNGPQYTLTPEQCKQSRRGELANFGPYGILAIRKIFNRPIRTVFARRDAMFYDHYRQHGVDDLALLTLTLDGGGVATILVGRTTTRTQPATDCRMQVHGSRGTLHIEQGLGYNFDSFTEDRAAPVRYGPSAAALFIDAFIDAIRTGTVPPIDLDDAAEVQRVIDAAYASAEAGQPETV